MKWMKGLACLLVFLSGASAQSIAPVSWQAETRAGALMEEALPRTTLEAETAERLAIRREPVYLAATPLYRRLVVGQPGEIFAVVADPGATPRLWIDLNRNGDLTDDYVPPARREGPDSVWDVILPVKSAGQTLLRPYRFRLRADGSVDAQARYGLAGRATLDGKSYACLIQPADVTGEGVVWGIDLNGDGRIDGNPLSGERFDGAAPFHVDGRTYQLARRDGGWRIEESDAEVEPKRHIAVGQAAPDFPFAALGGESGRLRSQRSWVLLDFWASWCHPCWDEIPRLRQLLASNLPASLAILGISLDDGAREGRDVNELREFARSRGITWPVVYDHPGYTTSIARLYNVDALPIYVLIDPSGVIRWIGREDVQAQVKQHLAAPPQTSEAGSR